MGTYGAPRSVLVLDNCAIHNKSELKILGSLHSFDVLFLPPYCPMYNPIENMFGTYKTWLRSNRDLVCQIAPYDAIQLAFQSILPSTCNAWIRGVQFYNID